MAHPRLRFSDVSFSYDGMSQPVVHQLCFDLDLGWTGLVGANGVGKSTLLELAVGRLEPDAGRIERPGALAYCPQRTDEPPAQLAALLDSDDADAARARSQLGVELSWCARWASLSHGERKRAQLAVALWQAPALLAIDEPTNHLDLDAARLVIAALERYRGLGLIVSHDRALLDQLCRRCLFLEQLGVTLRPGGYSDGRQEATREAVCARRVRRHARVEARRLRVEAARRRDQEARSARKKSKRGLTGKDHDAKSRAYGARVSDGKSGQRLRQVETRLQQARARADRAVAPGEKRLGIQLSGARARRDTLLSLPAGSIELGPGRELAFPDLLVRRDDRLGLIGPNGSGKSTLLRHLLDVSTLAPERVTFLPQELDATAAADALRQVQRLPHDRRGEVMTMFSRLGSEPGRLVESALPSPGELRKLLISLSMARAPYLIVLDEPTNHLDLPSIECLEQALADTDAALVLVSHDRHFLARLTNRTLEVQAVPETGGCYVIEL